MAVRLHGALPYILFSLGLFVVVNFLIQVYQKEAINGGYSRWSRWGNCSKECGEGTRIRTRCCDNPPPGYFGFNCSRLGPNSDSSEKRYCFISICPINGRFGPWGNFSECDKTCGGGVQRRNRACNNPPVAFGGRACEGISEETRSCNTQTCPPPIHGGFSEWSPFSPCSESCGNGKRSRSRTCTNPAPQNGGQRCRGYFNDVSECQVKPCIQPTKAQPNVVNMTNAPPV